MARDPDNRTGPTRPSDERTGGGGEPPKQPLPYPESWIDEATEVAESPEQSEIIRELTSSLKMLVRRRKLSGLYVGADAYFAWVRENPNVRISPDVYLLDDPPEPARFQSWQTWLPDHKPPRWAVEVVSEDWRKDYVDGPRKYDQLGCRELVLFDPAAARGEVRNAARAALTLYRRSPRGSFDQVYSGEGPARCEEIACWLGVERAGYLALLRLYEDEECRRIVPTAEMALEELERAMAAREPTRAGTPSSPVEPRPRSGKRRR